MRQIPIQPLKRKCSGCGDIMTITKSDYHNNYILFDGKLYHKDCYFKTKTITKICYGCKRNISFPPITATLTQPDSVFYNNHFYHTKCFIKWCHSTVRKNKMRMTESLIRYDLKVLINKYGSYLKWKEQQKILANEKESEKAKMKDDHIINEIISARQHNEKPDTDTSEGGVDINALVDDIF